MAHRSTLRSTSNFIGRALPLTRPRSRLTALTERLFDDTDTVARELNWQVTATHWGLGRRYRDSRFDALVPGDEAQAGLPWGSA